MGYISRQGRHQFGGRSQEGRHQVGGRSQRRQHGASGQGGDRRGSPAASLASLWRRRPPGQSARGPQPGSQEEQQREPRQLNEQVAAADAKAHEEADAAAGGGRHAGASAWAAQFNAPRDPASAASPGEEDSEQEALEEGVADEREGPLEYDDGDLTGDLDERTDVASIRASEPEHFGRGSSGVGGFLHSHFSAAWRCSPAAALVGCCAQDCSQAEATPQDATGYFAEGQDYSMVEALHPSCGPSEAPSAAILKAVRGLAKLRAEGFLSEEDFVVAKARLLPH